MAFSFVKLSVNPQTTDETIHVMTYELGQIMDTLDNYDKSIVEIKLGKKECSKTDIADFISMIRMYCEQQEINYTLLVPVTVESMGIEKHIDIILHQIFIKLAKTIRAYHYFKRFGVWRHGKDSEFLQEVIFWARLLCNKLGFDYWELQDMGESKYKDRMKDLKDNGIKSKLKKEYQ